MASNKLLVSWNYDNITSSLDITDKITVLDTANGYNAVGANFSFSVNNELNIIEKEDIKTNKKLHFETLESIDTIQILDEDDPKISYLQKPSSIKLVIENSMYQIMSDDMLSMFATMETLAFKFSEASYKYKYEYDKLIDSKNEYFDKALNTPDLERYMEFYKWLDSSLGSMLDQLKPLSSKDESGLKNTVESHVLERPKFQHKLPLSVRRSNTYTNAVTVLKNVSGSSAQRYGSSGADVFSGSISQVIREDDSKNININYNKAYDYIQTAGKSINNRGSKINDTVFQTKFSAGDGLSELNRDSSGEFSVYNTLNNRAKNVRDAYNTQQAASGNINQGTASVNGDFRDNYFVQRAVPYTSSHYAHTGASGLQFLPDESVMDMRRNDILIDDKANSYTVYEPPIQFDVPAVHNLRVRGALQDIEVYSPYKSQISTFTPRTLQETGTLAKGFKAYFTGSLEIDPKDTFYSKIQAITGSEIQVKTIEILDNIYPRKDMMGRAEIRTKPNYEEVSGTFNTSSATWSENSYNNNTAQIRSFWRDSLSKRRRATGFNTIYKTGSINCLGQFNLSQSVTTEFIKGYNTGPFSPKYSFFLRSDSTGSWYIPFTFYTDNNNIYNSIFSIDANATIDLSSSPTFGYGYGLQTNEIGDIAPYNHAEKLKFIITGSSINPVAKPEFIQNNFGGYKVNDPFYIGIYPFGTYIGSNLKIISNQSYQTPIDSNIVPFYDTYSDYISSIKGKTQQYSIIPEYIYSYNASEDLLELSSSTNKSSYLRLLGGEKFKTVDETEGYYISDFNKFINKDSKQVKFKINTIKKLLPYNGFYPQTYVTKVIDTFYKTYLSEYTNQVELQTLIQPFFAPGILFNTIKSGIAVDFPIKTTTLFPVTYNSVYTGSASPDFTGSSFIKEFNYRVPFEALLYPKNKLFNRIDTSNLYNRIVYLDPTHYNYTLISGSNSYSFPYTSTSIVAAVSPDETSYRNTINNFLSEIPNFFLKESTLTYFSSAPESDFNNAIKNNTYEFTITIAKNNNFSMFKRLTSGSDQFPEHSLFGPPTWNASGAISASVFRKDAYAPYCPPYLNSDNYVANSSIKSNQIKVSFTATEDKKYSLDEILQKSIITKPEDLSSANNAVSSSMFLDSCLYLKNKLDEEQLKQDPITGQILESTNLQNNYKWIIQTKFETPLIDYNDSIGSSSISTTFYESGSNPVLLPSSLTVQYNQINGLWHDYGTIPKDLQSVQITLDDSGSANSLLDLVKFKKETKSIGVLADFKEISEAIVVLPFTNQYNYNDNFFHKQEKKYLFKINEQTINELLQVPDYKELSIYSIKFILETNKSIDKTNSIVDTMIKMINYNIPLHLNWLIDKTLQPFTMYIAEINHVLDKQDLADIWQGKAPKIANTPEEEVIELQHELKDGEMFEKININNYNIKCKLFKIKKRANKSYDELFIDTSAKYSVLLRQNSGDIPWYSYNWPYDYFSLVELVNVQAGEIYDSSLASGSV